MIRYNTSFRNRPLEDTLALAQQYAKKLGIVRVTETTWLDRIGIPVFASIRPEAKKNGLCVNSGKGFNRSEAQVGAYMEAIEFALCEPGNSMIDVCPGLPESMYLGPGKENALLEFCPDLGTEIDLEVPFRCVEAIESRTQKNYMIPAELVFYPFPNQPGFQKAFSSSTNGLASGNSLLESQLHGLLEVIERHVLSFHLIQDNTQIVSIDSLPTHFNHVLSRLSSQNLDLVIRYAPNQLGIPVFLAYVIDPDFQHPMFINAGYGCHLYKEIALSRAIAEAIQSRLVLIHGARDDIPQSHEIYEGLSHRELQLNFSAISTSLKVGGKTVGYQEIAELDWAYQEIEDYYQGLLALLKKHEFNHVLTVAYTEPNFPLQVTRTIVPKMEFYSQKCQRIGPLLRDYASKIANETIRGSHIE